MGLGYAFAFGAKKKKKGGRKKKKVGPKPMVQVKTMTGKVVFEAQGDLSIAMVKQRISEKHGIPIEDQRFLHNGVEIKEVDEATATVDKYNPITFVTLVKSYMENWEIEQDSRFAGYLGYA